MARRKFSTNGSICFPPLIIVYIRPVEDHQVGEMSIFCATWNHFWLL